MIGVVTDSNAQLPVDLAEAAGIEVVPLVVVVDGVAHREGVDLDVDEFYRRLVAGAEVTTSQPSPGEVALRYEAAVARGATGIVSVHVSAEASGTVNAARLAADLVDVPVTVVDSGQASFALGCCVLDAARTAAEGGTAAQCADAAGATAAVVDNVFVMGGLELAAASGRVDVSAAAAASDDGVPVMRFADGELLVLGSPHDVDGAVDVMVDAVLATDGPLRVGVGVADRSAFGFYDAFDRRLAGHERVVELVRYRCGPTVGAFTGVGTAGACWHPIAASVTPPASDPGT